MPLPFSMLRGFVMNLRRIQNKVLQRLYRPATLRPRFFSQEMLDTLDELDELVEKKITPLLAGLWED